MSNISIYRPEFLTFPNSGFRNHQKSQTIKASWTMWVSYVSFFLSLNFGDIFSLIPDPNRFCSSHHRIFICMYSYKLKQWDFFYVIYRAMDSKPSHTRKKEELSVQLPNPSTTQFESSTPSDIRFDRLQPSDQDLYPEKRLQFGKFVAREAVLDEEYWVRDLSSPWNYNIKTETKNKNLKPQKLMRRMFVFKKKNLEIKFCAKK